MPAASDDPVEQGWIDYYKDQADYIKLKEMAGEEMYIDLGMGAQEKGANNPVRGTYFNSALSALNYTDFGVDKDGDPKNFAILMRELADVFETWDEDMEGYNPELAKNSAAGVEWLKGTGANLDNVGAFGGASVNRIHWPKNDAGQKTNVGAYIVPILEKACKDAGVEIIFDTPVDEIIMQDGKAVGVKASSTGLTVNAKSVVLATGGFGANLKMVAELKPSLDGFVTTNAPGCTGDGIKMAQAVGAATVDMDQIQIHPTVEQKTSALITEGLRGDGAVLVNQEGLRFCDEVGTRDAVSAAELAQTGGYAYLIVDQKMVDASATIQGYIKKGFTVQGDTYEALAKEMGAPEAALAKTMETWNKCVADSKDAEFGRTSFANALDTAPYYAIKIAPGIHHTMGGVKINTETEVLKADGTAIGNLYAAGEVTGGVHGANRLGGNAVADIIVFGQIAGANAAKNAK